MVVVPDAALLGAERMVIGKRTSFDNTWCRVNPAAQAIAAAAQAASRMKVGRQDRMRDRRAPVRDADGSATRLRQMVAPN